jgi:hypothetical protein
MWSVNAHVAQLLCILSEHDLFAGYALRVASIGTKASTSMMHCGATWTGSVVTTLEPRQQEQTLRAVMVKRQIQLTHLPLGSQTSTGTPPAQIPEDEEIESGEAWMGAVQVDEDRKGLWTS